MKLLPLAQCLTLRNLAGVFITLRKKINKETKATGGSSWCFSKAGTSRINSLFSPHHFPPLLLSNLWPCHISKHDIRGHHERGKYFFQMKIKKEPQQKIEEVRAPATRLKVYLKNLIINCPLLSCSPSLCELFAAWQASKAIFQMLCSRCDNYKMHHHRILAFICFP